MSLFRKLRNRILLFLGSRFGHLLLLLAGHWTKTTIVGDHHLKDIEQQGIGFTWILWHGRMLLPIFHQRKCGIIAMVSEHHDGELIARVIRRLGYRTARGSSTRGGRKAFVEMVQSLRNGGRGAMLPDGPKGPRYVFKPGTMLMAQRAQIPMLHITFASCPSWSFRSWDRFTVPKPFSRSILFIGKPIWIDKGVKGAEFESLRQSIEQQMIREVEACDAMALGEIPIPAPPPHGESQ
jgi:lysophospholipid acyltransferase (LPLAT)-like uncharacterized protein